MTIREAEELLDNAICGDQGKIDFVLPNSKMIFDIGIMNIHKVYYDGGWRSHQIVCDVLESHPHGYLASVLKMIVAARVERNEYSEETLYKMYNLVE